MTFEEKAEIVISQLRADRDRLADAIEKIRAEIMQLDYDIESVDYDYDDMPQTEIVHTICREEVLQIIDKYKEIRTLPPVTPQPKMGRWIEHFDESGKWYECDQCHTDWGGPVNYCPNCGAKM